MGVNVAFGQDCMMDPWYSMGSADMLDVAHMAVHVGQMTSLAATYRAFDAVTLAAARTMGLEHYGLAVGCHADFVILQARDPIEAIRLKATRLVVVRRGAVIARTAAKTTRLYLAGRSAEVDASTYAPTLDSGTEADAPPHSRQAPTKTFA
jgi:cytosine deaminase